MPLSPCVGIATKDPQNVKWPILCVQEDKYGALTYAVLPNIRMYTIPDLLVLVLLASALRASASASRRILGGAT